MGLVNLDPVRQFFNARGNWPSTAGSSPPPNGPNMSANALPEGARETMPWGYLTFKDVHEQSVSSNRGLAGARIRPLGRVAARSYLTGQGETDAVVDLCYDNNPGWGNNADGVSAAMVLFAMRFAAAQQGFTGPDGGTMYTAVNGNQSVPEAMAASLGGDLLLERRVTAIRDTGSGVEVHCEDGSLHRADRVISSLPCSLLRSLDLDPGLEGLQAEAAHTIDSQILNQLHLVAKRPFWEDDGLAPSMWTDSLAGMVLAERKGATPEEVTSLTSWTRGSLAVEMDQLPNEEAAARIVADIERLRPAAKGQLEVMAYQSWLNDPDSVGDWAVWQPGQVTRLADSVARQYGRVHFCGEHTARAKSRHGRRPGIGRPGRRSKCST